MRPFLRSFAAVTVLGLVAGTASAADIAAPSYGYDWSGFYVGAHAGYLWGEADVTYDGEPGGGDLDGGFWGGALAGFNFQHDAIVFGLEGDFGLGDVNGKGALACPPECPSGPGPEPIDSYDYTYDLDWNAHIRARAGFAIDKALLFAAGGLAVAQHTLGVEETTLGQTCPDIGRCVLAAPSNLSNTESLGSDSQTHIGFTIGGGVEYALTDNVLLRAEYLYDNYGEANYKDDDGHEYDVDLTAQTVRAAVSFKF